ncbi:MAG: hypothetical protein JWM85_2322 [Acidimicrobiaceae bacterium]|nr:hypothetical protein [Acidimicrobiaceae bacterium]
MPRAPPPVEPTIQMREAVPEAGSSGWLFNRLADLTGVTLGDKR